MRFDEVTSIRAAVVRGAATAVYDDPSSGRRFLAATPPRQPELWLASLDGARRSYRKHGVESPPADAGTHAVGAVGQPAVRRWRSSGGTVCDPVPPVAYPNEKYSTVLMCWDSHLRRPGSTTTNTASTQETAQISASGERCDGCAETMA